MATLKDAILSAQNGTLPKDKADQLKQMILSGKMDAIAQKEGIDIEPLKNAGGKRTVATPDFLKKGAASIEAQTTDAPTKATAQNLQVGMTTDIAPAQPIEKPAEIQKLTPFNPLAPGQNVIEQAASGIKDIGGGLWETAKEMVGKDENKQVSGEGFHQAINGAFQLMAAPLAGTLQSVPGGEMALQGISSLFTAPAQLGGFLYEQGLKAAGQDPSKPEFQMAKSQIEDALNVGTALVTPKVTEMATPYAKGALNWGGKQLKGAGVKTTEFALPENVKGAEMAQNYEANLKIAQTALDEAKQTGDLGAIKKAETALATVEKSKPVTTGQTATQLGISGTEKGIGVKSKVAQHELYTKTIEPALKSDKTVIPKEDFITKLQEKIDTEPFKGRRDELQEGLDALAEEMNPTYTLETANKTKTSLDQFTPIKSFKGKDIANAYNQVKADFANLIRETTYKQLKDANIKKSYIDYSNLKELEKLGIKARTGAGFKGGFGGFWSSVWDTLVTPVTTTAGKYLYKAGDLLEFESPKPVKTVGEFIEGQGITKQEFESVVGPQREGSTNPNTMVPNTPPQNPNLKKQATEPIAQSNTAQPIQDTVPPPSGKSNFNTAGAAESAKLKQASLEKVAQNKSALVDEYLAKNGKFISTDKARELFTDIGYKRYNAAAVQDASKLVSEAAFTKAIETNPEPNGVLYSGGSGVGKTSTLKQVLGDVESTAAAILDGNLTNYNTALKRLQTIVDNGKVPKVVYIYRDIIDSFVDGVVKRMLNNPDELGRVVPVKVHLDNHLSSLDTVKRLYEDANGANIVLIDNSFGKGKPQVMTFDKLSSIKYPENALGQLTQIVKNLYKDGTISKEQYEAFLE